MTKTILAENLEVGQTIVKKARGRYLTVIEVKKSVNILVKYQDGKVEFFDLNKALDILQ